MPGEDQVRAGLTLARIRIGIGAQRPRGLPLHQAAAVLCLAGNLVACGEVEHQGRAPCRQPHIRRAGHPQVLADLHAQHQLGHFFTAEQQAVAKRRPLPGKADLQVTRRGRKMARLVKLPVVGDVGLCSQAQQAAPAQNSGTVVELAAHRHGKAHGGNQVQPLGLLKQPAQRLLRARQQRSALKEVPAGVPGQAKLREHHCLDARPGGLFHQAPHRLPVGLTVRHLDARRSGAYPDETVIMICHENSAPLPAAGGALSPDIQHRMRGWGPARRHQVSRQTRYRLICLPCPSAGQII